MENENNITTEVTEADLAAFDAEWDESPAAAEETEDDLSGAEAEETPETDGGDQTGGDGEEHAEPGAASEPAQAVETKAGNQRFTLKHLNEEKEYGTEEVVALAQKGLDYDRQRAEGETFAAAVDELGGIAELADMRAFLAELAEGRTGGIRELIDSTRATLISKKEGISAEDARKRAEEKRQQSAVSVKELARRAGEKRGKAEADKFNEGLRDFIREYPDVDARSIPKEVWDEVRAGRSLTYAYGRYEVRAAKAENEKLKAQLAAEKQNAANRQKSAGSMKTAGAKSAAIDPFDEGWDD